MTNTFAPLNDIVTATNDGLPIDPNTFATAISDGLQYSMKVEITDKDNTDKAAMYAVVAADIAADAVRGSVTGGKGHALHGTVSGDASGYACYLIDGSGNGRGLYVAGNIVASGQATPSDESLIINKEVINQPAAIVWSKELAWVDFSKLHDEIDIDNHNADRQIEYENLVKIKVMTLTQAQDAIKSLNASLAKATSDLSTVNALIPVLQTNFSAANGSTTYIKSKLQTQLDDANNKAANLTNLIVSINADIQIATDSVNQAVADHANAVANIPTPIVAKTAIIGKQAGLIAQQIQTIISNTGYGDFVIKTLPSGKSAIDYVSVLAIVNQGLQLRLAAIEKFLSIVEGSGITV